MHPESVEIKVTLSGDQVSAALSTLNVSGAKEWNIAFCEDLTAAVTPSTPLLDLGVILRVRGKSGSKGDSTIKLRPCRWSQLHADFFTNRKSNETDLKIEADWAGSKRGLAAALTVDWTDDRVARVRDGALTPASLFSQEQQRFLSVCSPGRVNLDAIVALPSFAATRWDAFSASSGGVTLNIRPERWTLGDADDFLELSIVSDPERAAADQAALNSFVSARSLVADNSQENKTKRVLDFLVNRAATTTT